MHEIMPVELGIGCLRLEAPMETDAKFTLELTGEMMF